MYLMYCTCELNWYFSVKTSFDFGENWFVYGWILSKTAICVCVWGSLWVFLSVFAVRKREWQYFKKCVKFESRAWNVWTCLLKGEKIVHILPMYAPVFHCFPRVYNVISFPTTISLPLLTHHPFFLSFTLLHIHPPAACFLLCVAFVLKITFDRQLGAWVMEAVC